MTCSCGHDQNHHSDDGECIVAIGIPDDPYGIRSISENNPHGVDLLGGWKCSCPRYDEVQNESRSRTENS